MKATHHLLLTIALGAIALLAISLYILPPNSPLIPYTIVALLALLAAIVKHTTNNRKLPR